MRFLHAQSLFWKLFFTSQKGVFLHQIANSVMNMTFFAHGGISIKKNCGVSYHKWTFKPQISSIFHFDRVSDNWMAYVSGVKLSKCRPSPCLKRGVCCGHTQVSTKVHIFWNDHKKLKKIFQFHLTLLSNKFKKVVKFFQNFFTLLRISEL